MSLPRSLVLVACLILAGGPVWSVPQQADKPRIIFDSDMSSDHDDVGDAAVLHGLASMGECEIIGMMVSSQNGGTALCMDAINTYYGRPDIPIGVRPDVGGLGEYAGIIASEFPHGPETKPSDFPLAVNLYRRLLAASPDHSVIIATTGYLNNVMALMKSGPDAHSPLNGMDLIKLKVKLWACAGGAFPSGDEFNFRVEPTAAEYVVNNWPVAVNYVGFDVGQAIYTGGRIAEAPTTNPVRRVYVGLEKDGYPYPSWGQIAIYQAIRGSRGLWGEVHVGYNTATPQGSNAWKTDKDPNGAQQQLYLKEISRTPVRQGLDAMFLLPPNNGTPSRPGEPSDLRATVVGGNRIDLTWTDNSFNETGFVIERRNNGVYAQVGTVGPNVTSWSDTGLASVANQSYRVKATNAVGDSIPVPVWVYSGWTEINNVNPTDLPLYTYWQTSNLRMRDGTFRPDHVTLNNDSSHDQTLTVDVDVSALGHEGKFYVYFLYQDANNWYRLSVGETTCQFEKRINGTITAIGAAAPVQNLGNGSPFAPWRISMSSTGTLTYLNKGATLLNVTEALALTHGKVGLGGWARTPLWENFRFDTGAAPAGAAPSITQHPSNQTVAAGATATFSVTATGTGVSYQWQKNNATIAGATSASYTTPAVTAADGGATFRVVVSNASGSVTSTAATLSLSGGGLDPVIPWTAVISDGQGGWGGSGNTADKAFDGSTSTFYDAAAGDAAYAGVDVGNGKAGTVTAVRFYARAGWTGRMTGGTFEGSNSADSGYVTLATVAAASDTAWTTVMVTGAAAYRYLRYKAPTGGWGNVAEIEFRGTVSTTGTGATAPSITTPPGDKTVLVGQTATFSVTASGTGPLSFQWQKNGANIGGAMSAAYTTPATTSADNGATFRVVVTNSAGSVTSAAATLTVTSTPPVDSDGDGLPDGWEQTHFGGLSQTATGDPDSDGASNGDEYAAGTDPMLPTSVPTGPAGGSGSAATGDEGDGGGKCGGVVALQEPGGPFFVVAALTALLSVAFPRPVTGT